MPQAISTDFSGKYIKHVVIVIQENRSFDNLFATFPGADGATSGMTHTGTSIALKKSNLYSSLSPNNDHPAWVVDYDGGKMDGFDRVSVQGYSGTYVYQYVDPQQIGPYWALAKQYVLADHMFQTQSSGSFTAHQDLIRGDSDLSSTESLIDFPSEEPWGCDAPTGTVTSLLTSNNQYLGYKGPYPCLTYKTLRDLLDAKQVSWKYYVPAVKPGNFGGNLWNAFDAIRAVRNGAEWTTKVSSPETNIFSDIKNHSLPAVSWVVPSFPNSDHPGNEYDAGIDTGPAWVAKVVNAIGQSRYWKTSAIVIVWDDWGGWYDHVAPPQLDYQGLGFRVPMIIVSPYAKVSHVSHRQYEFGSILRFVEDNWGLGRLGTTDERAKSIRRVFDFRQAPRSFVPIATN